VPKFFHSMAQELKAVPKGESQRYFNKYQLLWN
jgi:hypothetical protein